MPSVERIQDSDAFFLAKLAAVSLAGDDRLKMTALQSCIQRWSLHDALSPLLQVLQPSSTGVC